MSYLDDVESYFLSDDSFYEESSLFWRVFYMTPVFFNFRMRLYSGFVLSELTCISAGLGVYPEACEPKPGMGPSKLNILKEWYESDYLSMYNKFQFI